MQLVASRIPAQHQADPWLVRPAGPEPDVRAGRRRTRRPVRGGGSDDALGASGRRDGGLLDEGWSPATSACSRPATATRCSRRPRAHGQQGTGAPSGRTTTSSTGMSLAARASSARSWCCASTSPATATGHGSGCTSGCPGPPTCWSWSATPPWCARSAGDAVARAAGDRRRPSDDIEDPYSLLRRLRLGREEYCQRLFTMLILGGPYPRWNTRSSPSIRGLEFLRTLDELRSENRPPSTRPRFVDEMDLPARSETSAAGLPTTGSSRRPALADRAQDGAPRSHLPAQLPAYVELGLHHHPGLALDLTYLTPPLPGVRGTRTSALGSRTSPGMVLPLVRQTWGSVVGSHV